MGFSTGSTLENAVHTKGSCFHRAACTVHGHVCIEASFLRHTNHLIVQQAKNSSMMLAQVRYQVQHFRHFFTAHPARCAIGTFGRVCKIAVLIIFTAVTVSHPHNHNKQNCQQANADQDTVETIRRLKYGGNAGYKVRRRHYRRCTIPRNTAALFPHSIIADKLSQIPACVQNRKYGSRPGNQSFHDFLFVYGKNLLSNLSKPMV